MISGLLLTVIYITWSHHVTYACPPPINICSGLYDPANTLQVVDTLSPFGFCVCLDQFEAVCFPAGSSFSSPATAYFQQNAGDCDVLCALSDAGEVCATRCEVTPYDLNLLTSNVGVNQYCPSPNTDACCPERGGLCSTAGLACIEPKCTETYTSPACLNCGCLNPEFEVPPPLCPELSEPCSFNDVHVCCSTGGDGEERCSVLGDASIFDPFFYQLQPFEFYPSLEDYCGGFPFDIRTCTGEITTDVNCCPVACVVPCDCAPLNEANAADWNLILQQGNGQNPTDILKSSPDSLHVGGPRRLFFNRVDEEAFCLSKITLEVKCARRVYIKINFKNALSQQFDVNIPAGSQSAFSTVTLGPYTHEDVASVRIGFNSANNGCGPILANELVMSPCEDTP